MFNILDKIKSLTSLPYDSTEVQQSIEDQWTDIIKENYKGNVHKHIQYLHPKVYDCFFI